MKFIIIDENTTADKFLADFYKTTRDIEFYEDSVLITFKDVERKENFSDIFQGIASACQNSFIIDFYGDLDYLYVSKNIENLECLYIPCVLFKRIAKKPLAQMLKEKYWESYQNQNFLIKRILNQAIQKTCRVVHYPKSITIKEKEE